MLLFIDKMQVNILIKKAIYTLQTDDTRLDYSCKSYVRMYSSKEF